MNPKSTVYLETTIPSYLTSRISSNLIVACHQQITQEWWEIRHDFELFISPYVIDEINRGDIELVEKRSKVIQDFSILAVDDEVKQLADSILKSGIIPDKASTDAFHIACATRHGIDFLLTWNCKHIANGTILKIIEQIIRNNGYIMPMVCTPEELMRGNYDE